MARLVSKHGNVMVATLERIPGSCGIGDVTVGPDGTFAIQFDGEGTAIDWDGQVTVTRNSQRVFLDEGGEEFLESELTLIEDDDEDDGCPKGDPDCLGNNEDCHDACLSESER